METEIAFCGLVCTNCRMLKKNQCRGCHNSKPESRKCRIRECVLKNNFVSCADCTLFGNIRKCRKLNGPVNWILSRIFKTDRLGNIEKIRQLGMKEFKEIC